MATIECRHITQKFQDGDTVITALHDVHFSAEKGELIAVIGPSGSGKSTFLTIAGGLQTPTEGEVLINGQSFYDLSESKRSNYRLHDIGFILQSYNLVPFLTVADQFAFIKRVTKDTMTDDELDALLQRLGIFELKRQYPEALSGGEKQRVAIAKALYQQPSVILADEPTASLDSEKSFEVVDILAEETHRNQKTTIMVTHDTRLIDQCDRVFTMQDGILTEQ